MDKLEELKRRLKKDWPAVIVVLLIFFQLISVLATAFLDIFFNQKPSISDIYYFIATWFGIYIVFKCYEKEDRADDDDEEEDEDDNFPSGPNLWRRSKHLRLN